MVDVKTGADVTQNFRATQLPLKYSLLPMHSRSYIHTFEHAELRSWSDLRDFFNAN